MSIQDDYQDLINAQSPENAIVPDGVFVGPPEAYALYGEEAMFTLSMWSMTQILNLNMANKGMDHFDLAGTDIPLADMNINSGTTLSIESNNIPAVDVVKFYDDVLSICGHAIPANTLQILTYGENMGTPLTGGTVGGWSIFLTPSYISGDEAMIDIYSGSYSPSRTFNLFLDSSIPLSGSFPYPSGIATNMAIGVNDSPTNEQIYSKIAELYSSLGYEGVVSSDSSEVSFVDSIARGWNGSAVFGDIDSLCTGVDPSSATITSLANTFSCTGSFTGLDGTIITF